MSKSRARVTRVPPAPPEPYYHIEANLDAKDAVHMANWLRMIWNKRQGLQDILAELERNGL